METILIVDDTKINIHILVKILGDDYGLIVSRDAKTALEMISEHNPDLVLLDIMMPEIDGFEVCKRIRSNPKTKDTPIIFLTSKTDKHSIKEAYNLGGNDYVTKPFDPKKLKAKIKKRINESVK